MSALLSAVLAVGVLAIGACALAIVAPCLACVAFVIWLLTDGNR